MSAILAKLRGYLTFAPDRANHIVWGQILFIAGAFAAKLLGRAPLVVLATGILLAGVVAASWEAVNHKADAENPFDWRDVGASVYSALATAIACWVV